MSVSINIYRVTVCCQSQQDSAGRNLDYHGGVDYFGDDDLGTGQGAFVLQFAAKSWIIIVFLLFFLLCTTIYIFEVVMEFLFRYGFSEVSDIRE